MPNKIDSCKVDPQLLECARRAYKAYAANSDGKTFDGREMPPWEKLTPAVHSHWCAATMEAAHYASEVDRAEREKRERTASTERVYREDKLEPAKTGVREHVRPDPAIDRNSVTPPSGVPSTDRHGPGPAGGKLPGVTPDVDKHKPRT